MSQLARTHRLAGLIGAALCAALAGPSHAADGSAAKSARAWVMPRLPDGQPDLQGIWTNSSSTPFERPAELQGRAFLREDEIAAAERKAARTFFDPEHKAGDVGRDNEAFIDSRMAKTLTTRQTSLVVEPADGRVPLLPEAERRRDFNLTNYDSWETMSPWERCITRGPTALLPSIYNNAYQIVQTSDHVVIAAEMIHEARIVPLRSGGHVNARIRDWTGDARGHWEGDTLVVDTSNYNDRGWIATPQLAGRVRGVPHTTALHLVERFTRVSADTIAYEVSIEDPGIYAAPWKFAMPLVRDDGYQMFEYACHEGNWATEGILRGARVQEKQRDEVTK